MGLVTTGAVAVDILQHPQRMKIMNVVWPVTALYLPGVGWWLYRSMGRPMAIGRGPVSMGGSMPHPVQTMSGRSVDRASVLRSATHCGSGCVIGDIIGAPMVMATSWALLGQRLYAEYVVEFAIAYVVGIAFQYIPIRSVRQISRGGALLDAVRSETLALIAFEVGLFGWMAVPYFVLFAPHPPEPSTVVFWFMMQIGMILGLLTSYPANWWLVKSGIKSGM
jgi:hypothetical protein